MAISLRRLADLPGMADLETKALMTRAFAEPEARADYPELDERSLELFGLTADQAEAVAAPADLKKIAHLPIADQVAAFEAAGWDVTDKRRPLRTLEHFNQQLWLAIHGVAGHLPFQPQDDEPESGWASNLAADAARFRKR